ncbi:calmodulin-like protein 4 [Xyrauchen texanus]|uniref:calmodulin-like protein 4 n=1 Tax=Xyrauchen texanus TaxID=154827 RepID=UPI002242221F|nr:calmodulin-like protein 4 [Xyrauchen texanus]
MWSSNIPRQQWYPAELGGAAAQTMSTDKSGELDFSTFLSVMHRLIQKENPWVEIMQVLKMMDQKKQGFIIESELKAKLMGLGERLTDEEVNESSVASDGRIDYEAFIKTVNKPEFQNFPVSARIPSDRLCQWFNCPDNSKSRSFIVTGVVF